MFDLGFSEMLVIALVALVVIGPERLPKVARTIGTMLGRLQRYVNDVKAEVEREMHLEELRKLQTSVEEQARSIEQGVRSEMSEAQQSLRKIAEEAAPEAEAPAASATDAAPEPAHPGQLELGLGDRAAAPKQA
jgi:sec-independent protein translocase protein TatB